MANRFQWILDYTKSKVYIHKIDDDDDDFMFALYVCLHARTSEAF